MARSAPSACTEPGCPELVHTGTKCEAHKQDHVRTYRESPERRQYSAFYSSPVWRAISKAYRKRYPLCAMCMHEGTTTVADVVDHIIEIRDDWSMRHDASNLMSLCHRHHNAKTRAVRATRGAHKR